MKTPLVIGLASVGAISVAGTRQDVNFNYAWRFQYGDDGGDGPWGGDGFDAFETLAQGSVCTNSDGSEIEHNPNRFNSWDCEISCLYSNMIGDDAADSNPADKCLLWQQEGRYCYHSSDPGLVCVPPSDDVAVGTVPDDSQRVGGLRPQAAALPLKKDYALAAADYDDSEWVVVDAPHDFSVENGTFSPDNDFKHGYLPRTTSWYRKHFTLPEDFDSSRIEIHFGGCFHVCSFWLNGEFLAVHTAGYTEFTVRLDNSTSLKYGEGEENVLAVRADASFGSGHWYEGGGLYRGVTLMQSSPIAHFPKHGVFVASEVGTVSGPAVITSSVEVELAARSGKEEEVYLIDITVTNSTTSEVVAQQQATVSAASDVPTIQTVNMTLLAATHLQRWSMSDPALYTVKTTLTRTSTDEVMDEDVTATGFRTTEWNATGFYLNDELVKLRGFSHHGSFAGVGAVTAPRVNLFKIQSSKALGANTWRMSHNPYGEALYKQLSSTGQVVWDESRDFGYEYRQQMEDLAKSHRSHTSIVVWSYGNEYELQQVRQNAQNTTNFAYREAALSMDPTRSTAENDLTLKGYDELYIDVKGWSHAANSTFVDFKEQYPDVPQVLSECCSCMSQRTGSAYGDRTIDPCIWEENSPLQIPYVAGSLGVWTLFDYFGEPGYSGQDEGWPEVSSSYGQYDLCGFPKPHAYWYRANWLSLRVDEDFPGLPACDAPKGVARVTNLLDALNTSTVNATHQAVTINAVAFGASATLFVNGESTGEMAITVGEYPETVAPLEWEVVQPAPLTILNATLLVHGASGQEIARHVLLGSDPTEVAELGIELTLDVPSAKTGTGSALLLDGEDTAMVRAALIDLKTGALVSNRNVNVTIEVVNGPGRLVGVGNGNPNDHTPPKSSAVQTWGGLARAFVQVNVDATGENRQLTSAIDVDDGARTVVTTGNCKDAGLDAVPIVIRATAITADGEVVRGSEELQILVSCSPEEDGWEAVAAATATSAAFSYIDEFVG